MASVRVPIWRLLAVLAVLTFGWTSAASAQGGNEPKKPKKVKAEQLESDEPPTEGAKPNHKGMQAYVDPDTGNTRKPTDAESQQLAQELKAIVNDSHEGLTPVELPNGAVAIDLEGRFMNVSVATIDGDGKLSLGCASTLREALELMLGKATPKKEPANGAKPIAIQPKKPEVWDER